MIITGIFFFKKQAQTRKFSRNNMDKACSPYLRQHAHNKIFWQTWDQNTLDYAHKHNKLLFVSIGYAQCYWCYSMSQEVFNDNAIADYLNKHFVSVKIDREQRPDIAHYATAYMQETQGASGWPLNVIITPDQKPFFAITYVPLKEENNTQIFLKLLMQAKKNYDKHKDKIPKFIPKQYTLEEHKTSQKSLDNIELNKALKILVKNFDPEHGGFGTSMKFPPYSTLLFLSEYLTQDKEKNTNNTHTQTARKILEKTLDSIAQHGLHDHIQGGFYRYCTDRTWTKPHFEKMLYDQALMLWVYSMGHKVLQKQAYKTIIQNILSCLKDTFEHNGLFYAGHAAYTNNNNGEYYLWTKQELEAILTVQELSKLKKTYDITENIENKIHLIKKELTFEPAIENKLLHSRLTRQQPFIDKTIITSWNAILGIALLQAYRATGIEKSKDIALRLFEKLLHEHYKKNHLIHSCLGITCQQEAFLEDYATMLLFATHIHEETGKHKNIVNKLFKLMQKFYNRDNIWYENNRRDFANIPAQAHDTYMPSIQTFTQLAQLKTQNILRTNQKENFEIKTYRTPLLYDFHNFAVLSTRKNNTKHLANLNSDAMI